MATTTLCAGLLAVSASPAQGRGLAQQYAKARRDLRSARAGLEKARAAYRTFLAGDPLRSHHMYLRAIRRARAHVHKLRARVKALRRKVSLQRSAADHGWWPIIREAARKEGISAAGLHRLMILESGGRATITAGQFYGLYMYCYSTWKAAWNPWRDRSILSGEAQIRATARAIKRGWGPRMWPNTYPMAF